MRIIRQIFSFSLPIIVLIIVPMYTEKNIGIKSIPACILGGIIILAGLTAVTLTVADIIRIGKGTLAPWSPSSHLVIRGLYRYVRNPMILGVLIVLIGESVAISSKRILIWALCFFAINTIWFIIFEEPGLTRKFGNEYREYKRNVPRWIPRFRPYNPESES